MKNIRIVFAIVNFLLIQSLGLVQAQTPISPFIIGNNYWIPGGTVTELMKPGGLMAQSKIQTIRVGGFGPNNYSDAQYLEYTKRIIAMGATPIVQVKATLSADQAIAFIKFINVTNKLNVRIWSIGNEPDHGGGGYLSDAQVETYTKRIAEALKSVDPTITIIGAEYAGYSAGRYANLIGGGNSITGLVPGKDYYYVDVIGFHKYDASGLGDFSGSIDDLTKKITAENLKRPAGKKLQWGMGEFNSHWDNDETNDPDKKVWSFNNGQMHAELYGYGMQKSAFSLDSWSMAEGEVNRAGTDLSLFDKDFVPRSSYWHSAMLAQNMKANYLNNTDNKGDVAIIPMGDATGTAVMIVNKNKTTGYNYTVKLDMNAGTANTLTVNVNAGVNKEVTGNIGAVTTIMLVFDATGNLIKTITYSKADADIRKAPTTTNGPAIPPVVYNHILPKKIEAEQFNTNVGLELETTIDAGAGQDLGYTDAGDYAEYGIEVTNPGNYQIDFRVASLNGGASLSLLVDNVIVIPSLTIASTTGWQVWKTLSDTISLTSGKHTLRFNVVNAGFNINWMNFTKIAEKPILSFTNIKNGDVVIEGTDLNINVATTHSTGIANVQLFLNNTLVRQENLAPYDWGLGVNDPQLNTLAPGIYTLKALSQATNGDTASVSIKFTIKEVITSIFSLEKNNDFFVYPNPALYELFLSKSTDWSLFDANGKNIRNGSGDTIFVNDLKNGFYIIKTPLGEMDFLKK